MRYRCGVCGWVYDEAAEGSVWSSLPHEWVCPICAAEKSSFEPIEDEPGESGADAGAGSEASDGGAEDESAAAPAGPPGGGGRARGGGPSRAILIHRVFGYAFLAIYVVLILQMVPRLWTYQIEFPARTVLHIGAGMAVGVLLILKIAIARFFRRLDPVFLPALGTTILVTSVVLIGISVPAAFREALATARLTTEENRQRVAELLGRSGLSPAEAERYAEPESLRAGQSILRSECVACHDLRTVLARPRTPASWRQTVSRMADRSELLSPLGEEEQWKVTAYLVAISPRLQRSDQSRREETERAAATRAAAQRVAEQGVASVEYDPERGRSTFEQKCSQCHKTRLVAAAPPTTAQAASDLVARMVGEGLEATEEELAWIARYLAETYASGE